MNADGVFEVGDIVRLKHARLYMTIKAVSSSHGQAACVWYNRNEDCVEEQFPFECLTLWKKEEDDF